MAQNFIFQNHSLPFFGLQLITLCLLTNILKHLGILRAKRLQIHEKFDETNSELEKTCNLIQAKKAPRSKRI